MGLLPMFKDPQTRGKEKQQLTDYLIQSADELDQVIKNISQQTSVIPISDLPLPRAG